jgi:hypothetical protein
MRLAGAARTGDQDGDFFADQAARRQVLDEGPVDAGIEVEVTLLQRFRGAEIGSPSP